MKILKPYFDITKTEAGCDEAGRGALAGPVVAAAVILPKDFMNNELDDSKKLTKQQRIKLREIIEARAVSFSVQFLDHTIIDQINILNASIQAMHNAVDQLNIKPDYLLIDGNRFHAYPSIPHLCIIGGDGLYMSIAAASVMAKTSRDKYMTELHEQYPVYGWNENKGYGTKKHVEAIIRYGLCPYHRKTFQLKSQLRLPL